MSKGKLAKFREMEVFSNVFQPPFDNVFKKDFHLKGKWNNYFGNDNPIVVELGCGKGEYSNGMARLYPAKNFIGIDIKGARIWKGAKEALENGLKNVAYIRTRIEFINSFFEKNEIDEIWLTFPDPQIKERRAKKRLTSSRFLNAYRKFLKQKGEIHLKTDSYELFDYTLQLIKHNNLSVLNCTDNLYTDQKYSNEILDIKTYYESMFLKESKSIKYIRFCLDTNHIIEPEA